VPPSYGTPPAGLTAPWFVGEGALGQMDVIAVRPESADGTPEGFARAAAADARAFTQLHHGAITAALGGDGPAAIERHLTAFLASTAPERWTETLHRGTLATVNGKTVWIRFFPADLEAAGSRTLPANQRGYRMAWANQAVERRKTAGGGLSLPMLADLVSVVATAAASAVAWLPAGIISDTASSQSSTPWSQVRSGVMQFVGYWLPFHAKISAQIYVDGQRILRHGRSRSGARVRANALLTSRRPVTLSFLEEVVGREPAGQEPAAFAPADASGMRDFDVALNAAAITRTVRAATAALRKAGLSAEATASITGHLIKELLNEQMMLNRGHNILTSSAVSAPFSEPHRFGSFTGTAAVTVRPTRLRQGRRIEHKLRYDIGLLNQLKHGWSSKSGVTFAAGAEALRLHSPAAGPATKALGFLGAQFSASHERESAGQLSLTHGSKTTLSWKGPLDVYEGYGDVTVTFDTSLAIRPVTIRNVPLDLAVHSHESPGFEARVLKRTARHPEQVLPKEPSGPVNEPHMLKDMRGAGFGVLRKLPYAADVVKVIRQMIADQGVPTYDIGHALDTWFGQEALEALDLSGIRHGVVHTLYVAGTRIDMAVQTRPAPAGTATSSPVEGLTINLRSITGGGLSSKRTGATAVAGTVGARARLTLTSKFGIDLVNAAVEVILARKRSTSLSTTAQSYIRTESDGTAQDHGKPIYYDVAVKVTRGWAFWRTARLQRRYLMAPGHHNLAPPGPASMAAKPPRQKETAPPAAYEAVVGVANQMLPGAAHAGQRDAVSVTTFQSTDVAGPRVARAYAPHLRTPLTRNLRSKQQLSFHEFPRPAGGMYPVIAAMPETALGVATMVARAEGTIGPDEFVTDLIDVPEQIAEITSPVFLQAHRDRLTSDEAVIVPLEQKGGLLNWILPQRRAMRIRMGAYDVQAEDETRPVEIERYAASTVKSGTSTATESTQGAAFMPGPRVRFKKGSDLAQQSGGIQTVSEDTASAKPGNHIAAYLGARYRRWRNREDMKEEAAVQVSRATYKPAKPSTWDQTRGPVEQTHTLLLKSGVWLDYELVRTRPLAPRAEPASVSFKADNALNAMAPVTTARELFPQHLPPALRKPPKPVRPGRVYIDPETALKLSAAELVDAHDVLPTIRRLLAKRGITGAGGEDLRWTTSADGDDLRWITGDFGQALHAQYSESALEKNFYQLINGGVVARILRSAWYGNSHITLRVRAILDPADASQVTRSDEITLMVRTEPNTIMTGQRKRGSSWWAGLHLAAIGVFGGDLAGGSVVGGYQQGQEHESEDTNEIFDFYRLNSKEGTYGFTHKLRFHIEVGATYDPLEIIRMPLSGLRRLWLMPGIFQQERASLWYASSWWSWQDSDTAATGKATLRVLQSLTREARADDGPAPMALAHSHPMVVRNSRWLIPGAAASLRSKASGEIAGLRFMPLAFPAATLVSGLVPWLFAPRLRSRGGPAAYVGLHRKGFDLGHMRGAQLASNATDAMLTSRIPAMLREQGFGFPVTAGKTANLYINPRKITYLPAQAKFKDRFYSLNEEKSNRKSATKQALDVQVSAEGGAYPNLIYEPSGGANLTRETEYELSGEGQGILENNVESTQDFHFLSIGGDLIIDAKKAGGVICYVDHAARISISTQELTKLIRLATGHGIILVDFPSELIPTAPTTSAASGNVRPGDHLA
jgi:hypothetical protein